MGVLGDIGIHLFDFASYAVGGIKSVNTHLKTFTEVKGKKHGEYLLDANDTALMQVEFKNGALGMLHATRWATGHLNTVQLLVCGTKGALRINLDKAYDKLDLSIGKDLDPAKWKELKCPKTPFHRCALHQVDPHRHQRSARFPARRRSPKGARRLLRLQRQGQVGDGVITSVR